jgi:hypothetical protein
MRHAGLMNELRPHEEEKPARNLHRVPTILADKTGRAEFRVKTRDKPVNRESGTDPSSIASATEENGQPALAPVTDTTPGAGRVEKRKSWRRRPYCSIRSAYFFS